MRIGHYAGVLILHGFLASLAVAAPLPKTKEPPKPHLTMRLQSWETIYDQLQRQLRNYIDGNEWVETQQKLAAQIGPARLPFIDSKKPLGAYATFGPELLQADTRSTQITVLLPVKGEKEALDGFDQLGFSFKKQLNHYSSPIPGTTTNLQLRFADDYAYLELFAANPETTPLRSPKEIFASKDESILTLTMHLEHLPKSLTDPLAAGIGLLPLIKPKLFPKELDAMDEFASAFFRVLARRAETLFAEGKELTYRVNLDAKSLGFIQEFEITPKPKTALEESIAKYQFRGNRFGSLVNEETIAQCFFTLPLHTDEFRNATGRIMKQLGELIANFVREEKISADGVAAFLQWFKSLEAASKKGEMDTLILLQESTRTRQRHVVLAMQLDETTKLESSIRAALKSGSEETRKACEWEVAKFDKFVAHRYDLGEVPTGTEQFFIGKKPKLTYCIAKDTACAVIGEDSLTVLKSVMEAKRKPTTIFSIKGSPRHFASLFGETVAGKSISPILNRDEITIFDLQITGGKKLQIRFQTSSMLLVGPVLLLGF